MNGLSLLDGLPASDQPTFLKRGGKTGALMARLDETSTPLGPPEAWPVALKQAVATMLASRFPMFIAWGEDLPYLYNDACAEIVGDRHPSALGRPFREVWPDVWPDLSPMLREALAGKTSFHEDLQLELSRGGHLEQAWFTFSYSPLLDETGTPRGVLSVAVETTAAVVASRQQAFRNTLDEALRDLLDPEEITRRAAELLGKGLGASRCGYGEVHDESGIVTVLSEWNDGNTPSLLGRHRLGDLGDDLLIRLRAGEVMKSDDAQDDHRLSVTGRASMLSLGIPAAITLPLVKEGKLAALIYVNQADPRHWSDMDEVMAREVAERSWSAVGRARAEVALRESEHELRLVTDALPVLIAYIDSSECYRFVNQAYEVWFGVDRQEIQGKHLSQVIGDDAYASLKPHVDRALSGEAFTLEQVVRYRRSGTRHVRVDYVPRTGENGAIEGYYVLVQNIAAEKEALEALTVSERRLTAVLESVSDGFYSTDSDWRVTVFNRAAEAYFGLRRAEVLGRDLWDVFPTARGTEFERRFREIAVTGDPQTFEAPSATRDGHFVELRAARKDGGGLAVSFSDITERHRAEEHRKLLVHELNHRVRNTLALIQGLSAQTYRDGMSVAEAKQAFEGRLTALAAAHAVLTTENWTSASFRMIVEGVVRSCDDGSRFHLAGPDLRLSPKTSVSFALALHELATNAVKYGALSEASGQVHVTWQLTKAGSAERLLFVWREVGGPPVAFPSRRGFGSRMLERGLASELRGTVQLRFDPNGLICEIDAPLTSDD